jgi:hypothetical protein
MLGGRFHFHRSVFDCEGRVRIGKSHQIAAISLPELTSSLFKSGDLSRRFPPIGRLPCEVVHEGRIGT